jgi:hypothetical protein
MEISRFTLPQQSVDVTIITQNNVSLFDGKEVMLGEFVPPGQSTRSFISKFLNIRGRGFIV